MLLKYLKKLSFVFALPFIFACNFSSGLNESVHEIPSQRNSGPQTHHNRGPGGGSPSEKINEALKDGDFTKFDDLLRDNPNLVNRGGAFSSEETLLESALKSAQVFAFAKKIIEHPNFQLSKQNKEDDNPIILLMKAALLDKSLLPLATELIAKAQKHQLNMFNGGIKYETPWAWIMFAGTPEQVRETFQKVGVWPTTRSRVPSSNSNQRYSPLDLASKIYRDEITAVITELENERLKKIEDEKRKIEGQKIGLKDPQEFETDLLKIKKQDDGSFSFAIKKSVGATTLVKNDGTVLPNDLNLQDFSQDDIKDVDFILLPENATNKEIFTEQPFKDVAGIALARPSFAGAEFEVVKVENNSILLRKTNAMNQSAALPEMSKDEFNRVIAPALSDDHKLGQGGEGVVYKLNYQGKDYALKTHLPEKMSSIEPEIFNLERLQYTNAVVRLEGAFIHDGKPYYIMELGEKSLKDVLDNNESIDDDDLIQGAKDLIKLEVALKKLGIHHKDIDLRNLVLTSDQKIKAIDIVGGEQFKPGYLGTEGNLLARALLEVFLGTQLKFSADYLKDVFAKRESERKHHNSPSSLNYWLRFVCEEEKVQIDCASLDEGVFGLRQIVKGLKPQDIGVMLDSLSRAENKPNHIYHFPQLFEDKSQVEWDKIFDDKDTMVDEFCERIEKFKIRENKHPERFAATIDLVSAEKSLTLGLYTKFKDQCKVSKVVGDEKFYAFKTDFVSKDDMNFQNWVTELFQIELEEKLMEYLGKKYKDTKKFFQRIFEWEVENLNHNLFDAMMKLYNK